MKDFSFNEPNENDPIFKMGMKLPIVYDWVQYKGETYFGQFNCEASEKAGKPMMDMSYCATRAMNQIIMFTRQWDKNKFKPSPLGTTKW